MTNLTIIEQSVNQYYEIAEKFYKTKFTRPTIDLNRKGAAAGYAYFYKKHLSFNNILLTENKDSFLKSTVPHEIAHLVAHTLYGDHGHGKYWKKVMVECFGLPPKRCHTYDVTNAKVRKGVTYTYKCNCDTHELGAKQHSRALTGGWYTCRKCKVQLTPINTVAKKVQPVIENVVVKKAAVSKRTQAKLFIQYNKQLPKEEVISFFVEVYELKEATAKVYYNKFKG